MGQTAAGPSRGQMHRRLILLIIGVYATNAARYQMVPICSKRRDLEAYGTTQTHCNSPVMLPDPFLAHCTNATYGRQHRCQRIRLTLPPEDWR